MVEQATLSGSTVKEEKKFEDMMELLAQVFTTPTATRLTGDDGTASAGLRFKATTERMIRLMEIAETEERVTRQTEKQVLRLTDAEKLAILSNASLRGPLDHDAFNEYKRLFYNVKGREAFELVFGEGSTPPDPLYYDIFKDK